MCTVLQIIHPGNEQHSPEISLYNDFLCFKWNQTKNKHSKKFIEAEGKYIDQSYEVKQGRLRFWAEWEGLSYFMQTGQRPSKNMSSLPSQIHYPIQVDCDSRDPFVNTAPHNSDPLLISDNLNIGRILYSNCKQGRGIAKKTKGINLKKLPSGTIIIFGTLSEDKIDFHIDCVFVTDFFKEYDVGPGKKLSSKETWPNTFRQAVYKPLQKAYTKKAHTFSLYYGKRFSKIGGKYSMFSFFPAIVTPPHGRGSGVASPALKIPINGLKSIKFNNSSPPHGTSHFVHEILNPGYTVWNAWRELSTEAFKQNYILGYAAKTSSY